MAAYRTPANLTVNGTTFTFRKMVLTDLPDAKGFLEGLLSRQTISPPVAVHYVKLVSRLKRQGRLADVDRIVHNVERTAANAYWRWRRENYAGYLQPVRRALARFVPAGTYAHMRRHALVPPFEGKTIPRYVLGTNKHIEWITTSAWTLHVPDKATPVHQDPCETCTAIELDVEQLTAIADAFEKVWGHRDLNLVPSDAVLFGEAPPDTDIAKPVAQAEKIAALATNLTGDKLEAMNARVTSDVSSFLDRLREGAEGVYLSKELCGARLEEVLGAVRSAWMG